MKAEQSSAPVASTPPQTDAQTAPPSGESTVDLSGLTNAINYRVVGFILLVALLIGVWWYASKQSRQASSKIWSEFARPNQTQTDLEAQSQAGNKHARLELARSLFGPQGIALITPLDKEQRNKGLANVQKARDEFVALADAFKGDMTLRAKCLINAAEAELALVGIPKEGSTESLGNVAKASEYYKAAAETIGGKGELAEKYRKRSEDLLANKAKIEELGSEIINRLVPPPVFNLGPKGEGPKIPEGPIPAPKPPETTPTGVGPKAPSGPITPPTGTITPPTGTPATAPAPTPPTATPPSKK